MILVTGAAGFIGSCLVGKLNNKGFKEIVIVDDFSRAEKINNYSHKVYLGKVERNDLFNWLPSHAKEIEFVFHIGARTDTSEFNTSIFDELNLSYSKKVWAFCSEHDIPLVYASSAATYGDGSLGYDDRHDLVSLLQPLNPYGVSKNEFDKWVLKQPSAPSAWFGLKFFNVYGPNEYHKGRMASVVFHAFNQIKANGKVKLFRSHRADYQDGKQLRDFIYVKDVVDVLFYLYEHRGNPGIYNLGTGQARTFLDLVSSVFHALDLEPAIEFIDTPADIRDKYQYFTEAKMGKLIQSGYSRPFRSLEDGITEYVQAYLQSTRYF
ncbi:MAG: ADP-glyceromanno-heptose 6-epimerase [Bacteroidetes bacterium]|nr:ADP-glyceromanno-heptose 6-epimerase [Bacteroidota bacterium]